MREIKYRGLYMGNWWFASVDTEEGPCDCWEQFWYIVDRKTVGQYIGLKDRNGIEIYKGDLVEIQHPAWHEKCIVEFKDGSFIFRALEGEVKDVVIPGYTFMRETWKVKVIGNIYQNPELLNEKL